MNPTKEMKTACLITPLPPERFKSGAERKKWHRLIADHASMMAFVVEGPRPKDSELGVLQDFITTFEEGTSVKPGKIYLAKEGEKLGLKRGTIHTIPVSASAEHSAALYRRLIEYSEEAISIISMEGKPLFVSEATARIFGCGVDEVYEMGLQDVVHPEDQQHVKQVLERAMSEPGKVIPGGAVRVRRKDGSWRWCEASITNMLHDKEVNGIIDTFRDVTELVERKIAAEFAKNNTSALINSTADAMWSIDENRSIVHFNRSFEKMVSLSTGKEISPDLDVIDALSHSSADREMWEAHYKEALSGKKVTFTKVLTLMKTGERRWCEVNLMPIRVGSHIHGVAASSHDITKMKSHSARLEALNEKLTMAQRLAKLGQWELQLATRDLDWSAELMDIWGLSGQSEKITFEMLRESVHPDDKQVFDARFSYALSGQGAFELTHRIVRPDKEVRWVKQLGILELDGEGTPIRLAGVCQDITRQKLTEQELEHRNAFIETAMDNLPIGIAVNEVGKGNATFVNKMFAQAYGWPKHAIKDTSSFFNKVYPDKAYREKMQTMIMADIESGDPARMAWNEITVTGQDGIERQVNARNIPLPEQGLMVSTVIDVTQEVKNRRDLKLSNDRYKYASKASFDAMWDYDVKNETLYWGDGLKDNFGHSFRKNISHLDDWARLLHPEDHDRATKSFENAIFNSKRKVWSCEYRMQRADGTYAHVFDRGYILRNANKKAYRLIGALQDVTQAKEEENKLRLREAVINSAKEGVIIAEIHEENAGEDRIIYVNEAFCEITGFEAKAAIDQPTEQLLIPANDPLARDNVRKARLKQMGLELEMLQGQGAGGHKWISCSMSPVWDAQGKMTHWVTFIRDITERRTYVDILQNQNKRLREIAFTQSHLVRTPLSRLLGLAHLLHDTQPSDPDFHKIIDNVKKSADELDEIIKSIVGKTSVADLQSAISEKKKR